MAKEFKNLLDTILCLGGTSKFNQTQLALVLSKLPKIKDGKIIVGFTADAGVFWTRHFAKSF